MVVVGFNLTKILVERKAFPKAQIKISTKMNILDIKKEEIKIPSNKDTLFFDFEFAIQYKSPTQKGIIAEVAFEGNVVYLSESKETKDILKSWKKKEINTDLKMRILNTILAKCNVKALFLEEEIGLPPHLPFPRFKPREATQETSKKTKKYTG